MPSPFPGMDPYLEQFWGDVHTSLTTYTRDQLRPQMPPDLRVRVEEYVTVESDEGVEPQRYKPDVRVVERPPPGPGPAAGRPYPVALTEPLTVEVRSEPRTLRSLRILDASSGHRIV